MKSGGPRFLFVGESRSGFTLIELMVVTIVLALLVALVIPRLDEARERAHFSAIASDFRNLGAAQERYYQANQAYTQNLLNLDFSPSAGVVVNVIEATNQGWAAVGTHEALDEGRGCAIYLGSASAPVLPNGQAHPSGPGVAECAR